MTKQLAIERMAQITWEQEGIRFALVRQDRWTTWWCGYCIFPKRPLIEGGYDGIASYVPVHGGITLAEEEDDGQMVYGFDCNHLYDEGNPQMQDEEWLKAECERMAAGILTAAGFEQDYLLADTNEAKVEVIERYHDAMSKVGIDFNIRDNFGAMIHAMFGNL